MDTFGSRLKKAMARAGVDVTAMSSHLGITYQAVAKVIKGTGSMSAENAVMTANRLGVTVNWLVTGEGPMEAIQTISSGSEIDTGMVHIPHYDTGGSMGHGLVLRDQPGVIREWTVSDEWITKNIRVITSAKNLLVVTGFGDSMRPIFHPGDPVMVDTGVRTVDHDGIYFFRVEQEGFIKRLQRIPGEGLVAISENKAYRDWTIKPGMDFEVFGRVVKAWSGSDY